MADNRTMAQLLQAPTEGYEDAIVIPEINANFELKHGLINLVQNKQFFEHDKEDPHAHIRYFNKITPTMRFPDIPSTSIKLMLFPFSLEVVAKVSSNSSTPGISPDVAALTTEVSELKNMMKTMLIDKQKAQAHRTIKDGFEQSANDAILRNMQNQGQGLQNQMTNLTEMVSKFVNSNTASSSSSSSLPSKTITNTKEDLKGITTRSGIAYQRPTIPITSSPKVVERRTEPVDAPISAPMPNPKPSIPYPSRRNDEKRRENVDEQKVKFYEIFKDMSFEISFIDALTLMPQLVNSISEILDFQPESPVEIPLTDYVPKYSNSLALTLTPIGIVFSTSKRKLMLFLLYLTIQLHRKFMKSYYDPEGDILILEALLNSDPSPPPNQENYLPEIKKELKFCEAKTAKTSVE
ncbi:hypothetical protein Tco_0781829 [Tanacetum coccineum]